MTALSCGCTLSASTVACAKNGRNVSFTPSRASKSYLARSRSRAIFVTSASTTVVSCAETCSDSTIRLAMTWRGLDIRWVVPRSADAATAGRLGGGRARRGQRRGLRGRCLRGGGFRRTLLAGGLEHVLLADAAADAGAVDRLQRNPGLGGGLGPPRGAGE